MYYYRLYQIQVFIKSRFAYLPQPGFIEFRDVSPVEPGPGECRVKLRMTGICGSDVHLFQGHRLLNHPMVLGHEGLGTIEVVGPDVHHRMVGQRVVIEPNIPCGRCAFCLTGKGVICPDKQVIGLNRLGCFASQVIVPAEFCWPVPEEITDADAVVIEPQAVGVQALFNSSARPGDTIAVVGLGAIGLLLTHLAVSLGFRVLASASLLSPFFFFPLSPL